MEKINASSARIVLCAVLIFLLSCKDECEQQERCFLEPDTGPCEALIPKYYYDKEDKKCREFTWGGCDGVVPFDTLEECKACECSQR